MKVTVKSLESGSVELEVSDETTVRQLKVEVFKKLTIPVSRQRLIYQTNVLQVNRKKLKEYFVEDGAEIQVVMQDPPPEERVGLLPQVEPEEEEDAEGGGEGESGAVNPEEIKAEQTKKDEEHSKETSDREKKDCKEIHRYVKNANQCIEWAGKILDRYERAEEKRVMWRRAREAGIDLGDIDRENDPDEKPEPRPRRFPWMDDSKEPAPEPLSRSDYADLLEMLQMVQDRGRPLTDEYQIMVADDPSMDTEKGLQAERLSQTIKDFNYYMGHAMISVSRLQMTMNVPPPREVKLAPTRRTEMRRVMRDLRNMPPRAPSGYIVDIQRQDGPAPTGTQNAPAPTNPLTSVPLGGDKKKKDDKKKDVKDSSSDSSGATGTGPAPGPSSSSEEKSVTVGGTFNVKDEGKEGEGEKTLDIDVTGVPGSETHQVSIKERETGEKETQTIPAQETPAEAMEQNGAEGEQKGKN